MKRAYISEIYPTIQGEGPFAGQRQIFVRLAGCSLACDFCDTPHSLKVNGHPSFSVHEVLGKILELRREDHIHTVSFTGGEPLLQADFLQELLPALKREGFQIYLDTAGVHPQGFRLIRDFCDMVAMDIKLPGHVGREYWADHAEFMKQAAGPFFVKVVVARSTNFEELKKAVLLVATRNPQPVFVIQPATPVAPEITPPSQKLMDEFAVFARSRLRDVRVIPQLHRQWGLS